MSRRSFLARAGAAVWGALAAVVSACTGPAGTARRGGGFGERIVLPLGRDQILASIRGGGRPFYYAPGRFWVVPYDTEAPAAQEYVRLGVASGGLMALYQKCPHLGCRVPFCDTSQWFECPCHPSKFNRAGEFQSGPAPRGMDRFPIRVRDGAVIVDTSLVVTGPARGIDTIGQESEGPHCVEVAGA